MCVYIYYLVLHIYYCTMVLLISDTEQYLMLLTSDTVNDLSIHKISEIA